MKNSTFQKKLGLRQSSKVFVVLIIALFLGNFSGFSQVGQPFLPRLAGGNIKVKGDVVLIGNSVINRVTIDPVYSPAAGPQTGVLFTGTVTNLAALTTEANTPFNLNGNNNSYHVEYSNVDPATGVFSSSSADLLINNSCKRIVFAGLYWSAIYPYERSTDSGSKYNGSLRIEDWRNIKFKLPGGNYQDITADEVVFDGYNYTNVQNSFNDSPYVCFKNVTTLLQGLSEADGTYTVANVRAGLGRRNGGGAGGWNLVVIYESPTMPSKYISVFDGYVGVNPQSLQQADFTVSGFQTLPSPLPVNAKIGVAALEGDNQLTGDSFQFKAASLPVATAFTKISDLANLEDNFFNATISNDGAILTNRNPASTNSMGFDIDNVVIPNPGRTIVPNDETGATLRLTTSRDGYGAFVTTFAVDIIEPKILLTKEVRDVSGNDASNQDVTLGQSLYYRIGFENQGNDDATSFTIKDILPVNVTFNETADIVSVPPGVTHTYNAATRTIIFTIPNTLVTQALVPGGPFSHYNIDLRVKVASTCNELSDACENRIQNSAYATYKGTTNPVQITDDPSLSAYTSCNLGTPQATNFLVGVSDCLFTKNEVLCDTSATISASNGYASYTWTGPGNFSATGQTVTVTTPGLYKVFGVGNKPCTDYNEEITVAAFGGIATNPVIPFADETLTCANNGKALPNIFLCGANDSRLIRTAVSDGSTIVWEKLNEASCTPILVPGCANESSSCTWASAGANGPDFLADTAGQYRVTFSYPGGCFNRFYFNVYKNVLNPTETHRDIVCNTNGNITVGGVGAGYEYSLYKKNAALAYIQLVNYQSSPVFSILDNATYGAGDYAVYMRQVGLTNPCIFKIENILIQVRNFTITPISTQPLCFGDKGSIRVTANNGEPQYTYVLFNRDTNTVVNTVGPIVDANYTFSNLTPDVRYQVRVSTTDGCYRQDNRAISQPPAVLAATAALTVPLTDCSDGTVVVTPTGGTSPYYYYVNGATTFQTNNNITVTAPGVYTIRIVDRNDCETTTSITVGNTTKPTYTIPAPASLNCYNDNGTIAVNLTAANGYAMSYSKDNGVTFVPGTASGITFSNLTVGTYNIVVRYSLTYTTSNGSTATINCTDPAQTFVITGPAEALTASSGVAELAGCTLPDGSGVNQGGKVRITNAQGGTPPYEYSFDGGVTYGPSPEANKLPGTYVLYVKDSKDCTFAMPAIILDPKPSEPTIDVATPVFNCDGTATSTVTVTNSVSNYSYQYLLDGVVNTNVPSNVFLNVPSGSHTVSVAYNATTASSYSILLQEDFGRGGDTTSPGINAAYCWEKQDNVPNCSLSDWHPWLMNDGDYVVTSALLTDHANDFNWILPKDHTAFLNNTPSITDGRFLAVNIGSTIPVGAVLYSKTINDVIPNQDIAVSLYMINLLKSSNNLPSPQLTIQLVKSGVVIASQVMPSIPRDEIWHSSTDLAGGTIFKLNPGNNTSLSFQVISNSTVVNGNDLAIDDILVSQIPKSCIATKDIPIVIESNKAFTASISGHNNVSCAGLSDGQITIAAENFNATNGFQYSLNNGTTWETQLTSPVTVTGLAAAAYTVLVRYDATASGSACVATIPQTIAAPSAITLTASVTTLATCSTGATITAVGGGGTPAYQYELRNAVGGAVVAAYQTPATFTNVPVGDYTVFAKDANSCVTAVGYNVSVVSPSSPTASLAPSSDLCYDTVNQATLIVNASGGTAPYTYSLNGAAPQNTNTFTNVGVGTHSILVTDSNNCTSTISDIIIAPELKLTATLAQDLSCLVDASITTAVVGGYTPFTYTVSRNGGAATAVSSFPYATAQAGNYVFAVSDSKTCTATSNTITVSPKTTPTFTTTKTDISCNNTNNGTITVTAANGFTSAYTYAIKLSAAAAFTTQATNQFNGLAAGAYDVKVIDSKECESAVQSVTIANPTAVSGTIAATDIQCGPSGTVPAVVTVTGSGGVAPYKYRFNGNSSYGNVNTYSTATAGDVTAYIQDNNLCEFGPLTITIGALEPITEITIVDNGWDCSTVPVGGSVELSAVKSGVANPMSYQIISGPSGYNGAANSTGIFNGLAAGSYVFQATDTKTNCTLTIPYTISSTPAIVAGGSVVTAIKCFGENGSVQFTVAGASASGYDYEIRNTANTIVGSNTNQTATTIDLANVPASTYTITLTDKLTLCTATYAIPLTQPTIGIAIATAAGTNVNCNNFISQITVTPSGGTPNYTYAAVVSGAAAPLDTAYSNNNVVNVNTASATNLVWDVYVKDANGCTTNSPVTIVSDPMPSISSVVADNQCTASGSNFTLTATATGLAPLTYGIGGPSGTFGSNPTFTVPAGTYTVSVKDANDCIVSAVTPITIDPQLVATSAVTKTLDCSTNPDAVITTTIVGGKAPYTYTVQKGSNAPSAPSASSAALSFTYNVSNVNADTYTFVITDANGCTSTSSAIISGIFNPTITATPIDASCNGLSDGSVTLVGVGGSGGYTYSSDNSTFVASGLFPGLAVGNHTFYVKDNKGCPGQVDVTIEQPTVLVVNVPTVTFSCDASNNQQPAVVTIEVPTTGTSPYTYSFNSGTYTATRTLSVNDNGSDQVVNYAVKDAKGCITTGSTTILKLDPPVISNISATPILCVPAASTTSTVTVTASAGVGTLTYEITNPIASAPSNTDGIFSGLAGGITYTFKVTDANGCYAISSHNVPVATPIALAGNKTTDVLCNGGSTGAGTYTVSGITVVGNYTYTLTAGTLGTGTLTKSGNVLSLTNVAVGTYTVEVTDSTTGCTSSASIVIGQPAVLSITSATATNVNCNNFASQITVIATGGTVGYTYAAVISGAGIPAPVAFTSSSILTVDTAAASNLVWDVYVKDNNGCMTMTTVTVIPDSPASVSASALGQCLGVGSYTITASGVGTGTLEYSLNGGTYQLGNTFVVPTDGTYTVRVKDANDCTAVSNAVIVAPQLGLFANLTKELTCSIPTAAQITLTPSGGTAPFTYESIDALNVVTSMGPNNVFSTNTAGDYTFRVTDALGCVFTTTTPITINPIANPTVSHITVNPSCNGADNGTVQLIGAAGSGGYLFTFNKVGDPVGPATATSLFENLAPANYEYTVTDSKGCSSAIGSVTISNPSLLIATASATAFSCSATNTKQAAVVTIDVPTTGTAPYTYSFNSSGYTPTNTLTINDDGTDHNIIYSVKDANGCIANGIAILINRLNPPIISGITGSPIYCAPVANTTSTVSVATTAGTGVGTLAYTITNGPVINTSGATTGIFTGLTAGTYTFNVTDASGCFAIGYYTVPSLVNIAATATTLTNVDCFGNTTGTIRYDVSAVSATYSYTVNGGAAIVGQSAATFNLPNLGAAIYNVVFTDEASACTVGTTVTITQPTALTATVAQVNANCNSITSRVTVSPLGGTAAYTYAYKQDGVAPVPADYIVSNSANLDISVNTLWDVWVKDANGCTYKVDVTLIQDPVPTVTASATNQCLGVGSYTITAVGIGGIAPLTYSLNGGTFQVGNTFVVTTAASYTIRVKDANGCISVASNTITVAPQVTLSATLNNNITCAASPDANITLTSAGGVGPYTYESKESLGAYTAMGSNIFTTTLAGSYTFRVTDAAGCTAVTTTPVVTTAPVNPEITNVTQTQFINCNGENTAAISITIDNTKGQAPFVFNVLNTTTSFNYGTQTSGLAAGDYIITVTDAKDCTHTYPFTILEPTLLDYSYVKNEIICLGAGTQLGSIVATLSGGTLPYTYIITNNVGATVAPPTISADVYSFDIVNFGIYELSFVDAKGCSVKKTITMASPPSDLIIDVNNGAPSCTTSTIKVTVNPMVIGGPYHFALFPIISGSTPPYDYTSNMGSYQAADGSNNLNPDYLESTFTNLSPGVIYSFIVYDEATQCYYFKQAESATLTASTLTSTVSPNNVQCRGAGNGTVNFTFTNTYPVSTDVTYEIFNSQTNLTTGISGTETGLIGTVTTSVNTFGLLGTGTYYILFTEASSGANNGCTNASTTFTISESAVDLSLTALAIKNENCTELGIVSAQAQGGTAPYLYQIFPDTGAVGSIDGSDALTSDPLLSASFNPSHTANVFNYAAGDYIIYSKDAYGCIKETFVTIDKDADPTINTPASICYDGVTPFTISISGTVDPAIIGAATYSVNGSAFQASTDFTFNAAGTYNLVIKDGNGCTANVDYVVYPKLEVTPTLTKDLDCSGTPNATITLNVTGGNTSPSANYTYEVSTNAGGTWTAMATNVYSATTDGTYDFRVTDANNTTTCQAFTDFTLDAIPTTVFAAVVADVSCNGGTDGAILVDVTAGEGPYQYSLFDGVSSTAYQASNSFTGLSAGTTYVISVRNARQCIEVSGAITIDQPDALDATAAVTAFSCSATNVPQAAVVTVNVDITTGTAPYKYNFDGSANYFDANTFLVTDNGATQTIHYYVKDANGCTFDNTVDVPPYQKIDDLIFSGNDITCTATTTDITVAVVGGYTPIAKYEIVSPSASAVDNGPNATFAGLAPESYLFRVTDANGCSFEKTHPISPVNNITVSGLVTSDVTCNEMPVVPNGSVEFSVANVATTYSYTINGTPVGVGVNASTISLASLPTGPQVIVVTDDATDCTATFSVTVNQPATPLSLSLVSNTNANCTTDAKVTVVATGGTPDYSYAFVSNNVVPTVADFTASPSASLIASDWDVWVKDSNGCTFKLDVLTSLDASPTIVMPASQCFVGTSFEIDLSVGQSIATPTATYTINGVNQPSPKYAITTDGTYQLSIIDANGCPSSVIDYIVLPQLKLDANLTQDLTCAVDGTITVTATDGTTTYTDYEVKIDSGAYTSLGVAASPYTATVDGTYTFRVTDSQGCQAESATVIVTPKTVPTATFITTDVRCSGGSDGTITFNSKDGVPPYTYTLTGAMVNSSGDATGIYTGLIAGNYTIVVTDAKQCSSLSIPVTIDEPTVLTATSSITSTLSCGAGNTPTTAIVTVAGVDGTAPYQFSFDGGLKYSSNDTYNTFVGTTFDVYVKDANGCISIITDGVDIPALNAPTEMDINGTTIYCMPVASQTSTVTISNVINGVGTLSYSIVEPISSIGNVSGATSGIFTGLTPDTYLFQVMDANGCTYQDSYTVDPLAPINIAYLSQNDISCNAANGANNDGSASFSVTGFSASANYAITVTSVPAALPFTQNVVGDVITLTDLTPGTYTVSVSDNTTLCVANDIVTITEPIAIAFNAVATPVFCSQDNSLITVSGVTGGTGTFRYAVVITGASAPLDAAYTNTNILSVDTNLTDLSWDVYVKDDNGCVQMATVSVTYDAAPTIVAPTAMCYTGAPLSVDLDLLTTSFNGNKTYTVNGSDIATSMAVLNTPGSYVFGVKDDNGCEAFVVAPFVVEKELTALATLTKDLYCAAPVNATIDVFIADGVAPYSYQMYLGGSAVGGSVPVVGTTFTASVGDAGMYTFEITDSNAASCTVTTNAVEATAPSTPTATFTQTNVSCTSGTDGTITVKVADGIPVYSYTLTGAGANTTGDVTGIYTGLMAGNYTLLVKDAKQCSSAPIPVDITEPLVLQASALVTPFGCTAMNAAKDAIVTITAFDGNPDYTYSFDGGLTFQASNSFAVNSAQTINYEVRDSKGCTVIGSAIVDPYTAPADMDLIASPIYCNTPGSVATVTVATVTGGVMPYTYEIISPIPAATSNTTGIFTGLVADTYDIKVTDAGGCSTTKAIVVEEADEITVSAQLVSDVNCFSDATGAIDFTVSNYITAGSYTFSLSPAVGVATQSGDVISYTNLPAGSYDFLVTDSVSGCTATITNFTISEPAAALNVSSVATNINCNNDTATVTISGTDGTAPYSYAIAKAGDPVPAVTSYVLNEQFVVDTNSGADLNWVVYSIDANGCTANNTQTIVLDANPTITSAIASQCPDLINGTYTITVVASGFSPALQYSVDGLSYDTSNVITVNAPGTYNVTVKDTNGCISTSTAVSILQPLTLSASVTSSPSCIDGDGVVAVSATGGSGNYVYSLDGSPFVGTSIATVSSGSHIMGVQDTTTLCEMFVPISLDPATIITGFALAQTPVSCNGGSDGTIRASFATPAPGVNDNPVYTYTLSGAAIRPAQDSPLFSGLAAGIYTVLVASERNCTDSQTIEVLGPQPIVVPAATVTQFGCISENVGGFATISVTGVTGGSGNYLKYEFIKIGTPNTIVQFGNLTTYNESDLLGGSYMVNVYDSNSCVGTTVAPITIAPYIALDKVNVVVSNPITCTNLEDITITATTIGGTPTTLEYTLVSYDATTGISGSLYPSQTNTTGVFTGLVVADYAITIFNPTTNCSIKGVHYVNDANSFDLVVDNVVDVTCFGNTNGSATISIVDALSPSRAGAFTYTVTGPVSSSGTSATAGPLTLTNLVAGQYTVSASLTNTPFCTVYKNFTIDGPLTALSLVETHSEITCVTGNNDGSISASASGGWSNSFEYQLSGPVNVAYSAVSDFTGLTAGTYTVSARDSGGCEATAVVTLTNPLPIAITASSNVALLSCIGDDSGVITVDSVTGGQGSNYSYTLYITSASPVISSGPQVSNVFTGLKAGTYTVTATDGWGCSAATSAVITIAEPSRVEASLTAAPVVTCNNESILTLTVVGGTPPYTYSATSDFAISAPISGNFVDMPANVGTYHFFVKDANGCVGFVSNDVKVEPLDPLFIDLKLENGVINCFGDATGVIVAEAFGGLGNYIYTLLDDATGLPFAGAVQNTPGIFTDLPAGSYKVQVNSGDCILTTASLPIDQPAAPLIAPYVITDVTCSGAGNGQINISASGGTGIIKYAISPNLNQFFDTNILKDLKPDTYTVIVQDELGCYVTFDFVIVEPLPIQVSTVVGSIIPEICAGDSDGSFSIEISGGIEPYLVSLDSSTGPFTPGIPGQTQFDFTNVSQGSHMVYINDSRGCEASWEVILPDAVTLNPKAIVEYSCINNLPANSVTVTVDSSVDPGDVDYSLDGVLYQPSNVFNNVAAGDHTIYARHSNGCIKETTLFTIVQVEPLAVLLSEGNLNEIVATTVGGSGFNNYTFNGEYNGISNTYIYYRSGDYTVDVVDSSGCTATDTKYFTFIDINIPNVFTPDGDGNNDTWGPTNTANYPDLVYHVYDRYGRKIATYREGQFWDGRYNGQELPTGDYWYVLKLNNNKDAREFVGHFTLYR